MNSDRPNQTTVSGAPTDLQTREPALVNLYIELTGEDEAQARNTFIFVIGDSLATP
jgi:hypothetical protein